MEGSSKTNREQKTGYLTQFVEIERERDPEFGEAFDREVLAIQELNAQELSSRVTNLNPKSKS